MIRTKHTAVIVYLDEPLKNALDSWCKSNRLSRNASIRAFVAHAVGLDPAARPIRANNLIGYSRRETGRTALAKPGERVKKPSKRTAKRAK